MMKFLASLLCLALIGVALGDSVVGPGCTVSVQTTARQGGSYTSGSGVSQIYDIVVTNSGSCNADNIAINIALASGTITEKWNLEATSRYYLVTGYEATLPVGNSVNTGIIVNYPDTQTVPADAVGVTVYGTTCPSECVNAQQSTSASAANTATTSSTPPASSDSGSSSSSTRQAPPTSGSCSASFALTARSGGSYPSGSGVSQIYDLAVTNSGSCGLTNIVAALGLPSGASITQTWNLNDNGNQRYTVTSYEGLLPPGSTVNAGFIVNFPNTQSVPSGVSANADSTTCSASCSSSSNTGGSGASASSSGSATTSSTPPATSGQAPSTSGSSGSCQVSATTTARPNSSFQSGSGVSQIYDVVVQNSGSCGVNNIELAASVPSGASIQQTWNLNYISNLRYTVTSYGDTLPSGNSVNVGFIVNFPNTQTVPDGVSASVATSTCNQCQKKK